MKKICKDKFDLVLINTPNLTDANTIMIISIINRWRWTVLFIFCLILGVLYLNSTTWFRLKLVKFYESKNNYEKAIKIYDKIYVKERVLHNKWFNSYKLTSEQEYDINRKLANYYFKIRDKNKAIEHYKLLKELNPKEIKNYLNLYVLEQDAENLAEVVLNSKDDNLLNFLPLEYLESPFWRYNLAIRLSKRNRWVEAEKIFQGFVSEYPYLSTFKNCLTSIQEKKTPNHIFDIVGIWKFDEGSGNVARDYSGRWNNGKIYGAEWVDGISGKALRFDGLDDYVRISRNNSLNLKKFTFCVWIKPLDLPVPTSVIIRNGDVGGHIAIHKSMLLSTGFNDGLCWHIIQGGFFKVNEWTFVVTILDDGVLIIYQDRKLIAGPKNMDVVPGISSTDLFFGRRDDNLQHFKGIIDEIQIFNRALSETEIRQLYQGYIHGER